jgi:hypothetical protein
MFGQGVTDHDRKLYPVPLRKPPFGPVGAQCAPSCAPAVEIGQVSVAVTNTNTVSECLLDALGGDDHGELADAAKS